MVTATTKKVGQFVYQNVDQNTMSDQIGVGQNSGVDQTGNYETIATKCGSTK